MYTAHNAHNMHILVWLICMPLISILSQCQSIVLEFHRRCFFHFCASFHFIAFDCDASVILSPIQFQICVCMFVCLTASDQMTTQNRLNQTKYNAMFTSIIFFFFPLLRDHNLVIVAHTLLSFHSRLSKIAMVLVYSPCKCAHILCAHAIYCGPLICVVYVYASDFIAVAYNWQFSVSSLNG